MPEVTDPSILQALNSGGPIVIGRPNPNRVRKDAADATRAEIDISNAPTESAILQAQLVKAQADAAKAEKEVGLNGLTADKASELKANLVAIDVITRRLDELQKQYETSFKGKGLQSIAESYAPNVLRPANGVFNDTAGTLRADLSKAKGLTSQQFNTPAEQQQFFSPFIPSSGDTDEQILNKIRMMRDMADTGRNSTLAQLGQQPTPQQPIAGATGGPTPPSGPNINLPTGTGQLPPTLAGGGGDMSGFLPRDEYNLGGLVYKDASVAVEGPTSGTISSGRFVLGEDASRRMDAALSQARSPDDVAAAFRQITGYAPDPQTVKDFMAAARSGRSVTGMDAEPAYEDAINAQSAVQGMGQKDRAEFDRLKASRNTFGGALDTFGREAANALTLGGADKLTAYMGSGNYADNLYQEKLKSAAGQQANPVSAFGGQVGGVIGATGLIGGAARFASGGRLMGGGGAGAFGRNMAADATYGGAYNAANNENPLTGALAAAAGSGLGQGAASAIGRAATGVTSQAAPLLRGKGVPLTFGQAVGDSGRVGEAIKGFEDRMAGLPAIGDVVNARRMEGLQGFNKAAFDDALAPIGVTANRTGARGVEDAFNAGTNAYGNAVRGVDIPLTPQFGQDLQSAMAKGNNLPGQMSDEFAWTMQNRVRPDVDAGNMTGEGYQSIIQGLRRDRASMKGQPRGLDFADSVRGVENVATDFMRANGGQNVVSGLNKANQSWRNIKVLQDAVDKAKNTDEVFTAAQLNAAASKSANKFGGSQGTTRRPFYDLGQAAQKLLPSKVPDSGTAGRLAFAALPATLGGTGAGVGYVGGDAKTGALSGLGVAATLAALGTKGGQAMLVKLAMDRPKSVRAIGNKIRKGKGLLGSASVPLFLASEEY